MPGEQVRVDGGEARLVAREPVPLPLGPGEEVAADAARVVALEGGAAVADVELARDEAVGVLGAVEVLERADERERAGPVLAEHRDEAAAPDEHGAGELREDVVAREAAAGLGRADLRAADLPGAAPGGDLVRVAVPEDLRDGVAPRLGRRDVLGAVERGVAARERAVLQERAVRPGAVVLVRGADDVLDDGVAFHSRHHTMRPSPPSSAVSRASGHARGRVVDSAAVPREPRRFP